MRYDGETELRCLKVVVLSLEHFQKQGTRIRYSVYDYEKRKKEVSHIQSPSFLMQRIVRMIGFRILKCRAVLAIRRQVGACLWRGADHLHVFRSCSFLDHCHHSLQ